MFQNIILKFLFYLLIGERRARMRNKEINLKLIVISCSEIEQETELRLEEGLRLSDKNYALTSTHGDTEITNKVN